MSAGARAGVTAPLILAAGAGRRMGGPKALARLPSGETFLSKVLATCAACEGALAPPVVVVGARAQAVEGAHAGAGARFLLNPGWEADDMFASVLWGLAAVEEVGEADSALIWPVDCPNVPAPAVLALLRAPTGGALAKVPTCGGRPGHPVWVAATLWRGWARGGAPHLRGALEAAAGEVARVEVGSPEVLENWNTPRANGEGEVTG